MTDELMLDKAYEVASDEDTTKLYAACAKGYDAELKANGYASPKRCAAALAQHVADKSKIILDIGCGTGLGGEALRDEGFSQLYGTDFSAEMLAVAASKPALYVKTLASGPDQPLPDITFDHAAAVGVFSPNHGPPELIKTVIDALHPGGCFVFTLNDHALEIPEYQAMVKSLTDAGQVDVLTQAYGTHLPAKGLKSMVYVLRKML